MPDVHARGRESDHACAAAGAGDVVARVAGEKRQDCRNTGKWRSTRTGATHGAIDIPPTTPDTTRAGNRPGLFFFRSLDCGVVIPMNARMVSVARSKRD